MKLRLLFSLLLTLTSFSAEPAEEARKLAETRDQEINRINLAYAQKLDALLAKAKTAGDTAAVKVIEGLIAKAEGKKEAGDNPLDQIVGKWKRDRDGMVWEFKDSQSGIAGGDVRFTMNYNPEKREISIIGAKWVDTLKLTSDADLLRGTDRRGDRYTLKRIK